MKLLPFFAYIDFEDGGKWTIPVGLIYPVPSYWLWCLSFVNVNKILRYYMLIVNAGPYFCVFHVLYSTYLVPLCITWETVLFICTDLDLVQSKLLLGNNTSLRNSLCLEQIRFQHISAFIP